LIGIVLKEGIKVEVSKKMEKWAAQELQYADLGDRRRKKRLISIVENLTSQLSTSVRQSSANLAAASARSDFGNSPYFEPSAVRMIASLGFFLGRKGDGEPSVKTIWLGLGRLDDISENWKLSDQISPSIERP